MLQKARRGSRENSLSRAYGEKKLKLKKNWQVGTRITSLEDGSDSSGVRTY